MARKTSPIVLCGDCGEEKPHEALGLCATCYMRARRTTPEGRAGYNKYMRSWREKNPGPDRSDYLRNHSYGLLYNITLADYDEMLEAQGGKCAICGRTPEEEGRRLSVDHDHKTGQVRGLLCRNCNAALGFFQDDFHLLRRAINYLDIGDVP